MFAPFTQTASHVSDDVPRGQLKRSPRRRRRGRRTLRAVQRRPRTRSLELLWMRSSSTATWKIVAIVEGCDESRPRLVQARHSYAIEGHFAWWHNFAPCVSLGSRAGRAWWTSRNFIGRWNRARIGACKFIKSCSMHHPRQTRIDARKTQQNERELAAS